MRVIIQKTCKSSLKDENHVFRVATLYSASCVPQQVFMEIKLCNNCHTKHYMSYAKSNAGVRTFYSNALTAKHISFTHSTVFEIKLLNAVSYDIIYKHSSFIGFCKSLNALNANSYGYVQTERELLNEKRLSESWHYFTFLRYLHDRNQNNIILRNIGDLGKFISL